MAVLGWHAHAQTTIDAPAPRFVAPGDYVTLVFTVHPGASGVAGLTFTAPKGWQVLGARESAAVTKGQPLPLAITVAVPDGAEPNTSDVVALSVTLKGARSERSVALNVLPQPSVLLDVPAQVPIDAGKVTAAIRNTGNVDLTLAVTFRLGPKTLTTRKVGVSAQQTRTLTFPVAQRGTYTITARGPGSIDLSRSVDVLAYGVPVPPPFEVQTHVSGSMSSDGLWGLNISGQGPLSDYTQFSTRLSTSNPQASFAQFDGSSWSVRLGAGPGAPHNLTLPTGFGISADVGGKRWDAFASTGHVLTDHWTGYIGGAWLDPIHRVSLAVAGGMASGGPTGAMSVEENRQRKRLGASLSFANGAFSASAHAEAANVTAHLQVNANAGVDATGASIAGASVSYTAGTSALLAGGSIDPATTLVNAAYGAMKLALPDVGLGRLDLASRAGTDTSYLALEDQTSLAAWSVSSRAGVVWDQYGNALSASMSLEQAGTDYLGLDGTLRIGLDDAVISASGGVRGQALVGPLLIYGGAQVNGSAHKASLRAGARWKLGTFNANVSGSLASTYENFGSNLAATVALRGSYTFPVTIPESVTKMAGGRREGTLNGRIEGAKGLEGVVVQADSYRLRVAPDGTFRAVLPAGAHDVRLDVNTIPVRYRIDGPTSFHVTMKPKRTTPVTFQVVQAAAVQGRVLVDTSGKGTADKPPVGVRADISLVDADGLVHRASSGPSGSFTFRGLPAGKAELSVSGLPLGDALESLSQSTFTLSAGKVKQITILVRPAGATATLFGGSTLHIRSVTLEASRAPQGAAPVVKVKLSEPATDVSVESGSVTVALHGSKTLWTGRVPIPEGAKPGLSTFTVHAHRGKASATRQGRVIVDPAVELLTAEVTAAGVSGKVVPVHAHLLAAADRVAVSSASNVGISGSLREASPGRWTGSLSVPAVLTPGHYTLKATAYVGGQELATTSFPAVIVSGERSNP